MQSSNAQFRSDKEDQSSFRRLATLLKPYSGRLSVAVCMLVLLALVNMLVPFFFGMMFDQVFPEENWGLLGILLLGILAVYVARNVLYFGSKFTAVAVGENLCFTLRNRMFESLQQQSLQFYKDNQPGKLSSRLMDDSFVVQTFIQDDLPKLLQATFRFIFLIAVIYAINWELALASTVVLPLHLWAYYRFKRPIKDASRTAQEQLAMVHGNLIEQFLGAEVVKGFTAEDRENLAFTEAIEKSRRSQIRSKTYHVMQKTVADLLVGAGTILLLGIGAVQVMGPNHMKVGYFIMFFGYIGMLYPTVLELMSGLAKLTKASASVDRVFEMLEALRKNGRTTGTIHKPIRGRVVFENVSFSYGDGVPVLKDINLQVNPGEVCAVVGPSGSGKSTLVSMLPRFNEPTAGNVELDGLDVRQIDLRHLRESIGIAFQECFLFNSSILENLQYANPQATLDRIIEVAKRTGAHDFISKLPHTYYTVVGESGISLSRGEKQRITLTRAMLKDPQILILDEATASIDAARESQIIPAILDFMRGKTTLMITHRPELMKHADLIVHLVDGQVVFKGPPREFSFSDLAGTPQRADGEQAQSRARTFPRLAGIVLTATLGLMGVGGAAWAQEPTKPARP